MEVKTIAVIGAGARGREIAAAAVLGGYKTVLEDISSHVLEEALEWIRQSFDDAMARGDLEAGKRDRGPSLLVTSRDVKDAICNAELIIETVPDELEMKLELFTIFDKFAKPGAIFASNTASLSIADFSDVTVSQDRCIGMRFTPSKGTKNGVELVRTLYTSEETVTTCREVARRLGREVILVNETESRTGRT